MTLPTFLIGCGAGAFLACLVLLPLMLRESDRSAVAIDNAWADGHRKGIVDERAERLARALWDADHDSYGGSE